MNILIRGYYGFGNFGDDILLITTYKIITERHAAADIYIFSNFNHNLVEFDRHRGYNHYIYKLLPGKPKLIDWTFRGEFDLLVDGGGGVYFDTNEGSWFRAATNGLSRLVGMKLIARIDRILRGILLRPRRICFKRRVGIGLGIGPYSRRAPLLFSHLAEISAYDALVVRDTSSLALLERFRFPGRRFLGTDLAFLTEYWMPQEFTFPTTKQFTGKIGIVLMDWPGDNQKVFSEFKEFAKASRSRGYEITFFSLDENHDKQYIRSFEGNGHFVVWRPGEMDVPGFLSRLKQLDVIITGRAHGAIIAGQLGVVPVCLGKTRKLMDVSAMFATSSVLIQEPFTRAALHDAVEQIRHDYAAYLKKLRADNDQNRIKAECNVEALKPWI